MSGVASVFPGPGGALLTRCGGPGALTLSCSGRLLGNLPVLQKQGDYNYAPQVPL